MLVTSGFPKMFWVEALHTVVHIVNRLPCSAIWGKIPEEIWRGKGCICLKYIRIFGCPVYIHVTGQDKLDPKATKGFLLGYTDGIKGYRIWNPVTRKVIHSRHVTFDESIMFKSNHNRQPTPEPEIISYVSPTADGDEIIVSPIVPNSSAHGFTLGSESEEDVSTPDTSTLDPVSSVQEEILNDGGGNRAIGCKWVYKVKEDKRYKALLVEKGFAQRKGIEYDDIFAHVVRHTSIRVLLALEAILDLELEQLDVKITFLHGDLEKTIYMKQPEGFISDNKPDWIKR
ncbi:hypothetical protein L6452_28138 [Arctium lappa]|uniref:Uncharacterized protein n=1 Tax=Arctium lappa TaxID=4217 RepID=A0ACB9A1Y8_ARCLA|nr:hypothetical protein L6452_28138 [Arctium lappa]